MCNRAVTSADQFNRQRTIKVQRCQLEESGVTENRNSGTQSICWHLINIWIWVWWKDEHANELFFSPTDWLWLWDKMSWKSKLLKDLTHVASETKILLHHFKEYQKSFTPDCAFPPVCVCMCTCTVTDRILTRCFPVSLCGLHTSSASVCARYTLPLLPPTNWTCVPEDGSQGTCLRLSLTSPVSPRGWRRLTVSSDSNKGAVRSV